MVKSSALNWWGRTQWFTCSVDKKGELDSNVKYAIYGEENNLNGIPDGWCDNDSDRYGVFINLLWVFTATMALCKGVHIWIKIWFQLISFKKERTPSLKNLGWVKFDHDSAFQRNIRTMPPFPMHAIVNSCSLAWGIPAMKLRKISGLMKELQEAIKTTKAYWPSLKQMRKNRHEKRDSRVGDHLGHFLIFHYVSGWLGGRSWGCWTTGGAWHSQVKLVKGETQFMMDLVEFSSLGMHHPRKAWKQRRWFPLPFRPDCMHLWTGLIISLFLIFVFQKDLRIMHAGGNASSS